MGKFTNRMAAFLYGRYGQDGLSRFLTWTALGVAILNLILNMILRNPILTWILHGAVLLLLVWSLFRTLSRNVTKRTRENLRFESIKRRLLAPLRRANARRRDKKTHVFKKCPNCRKTLRLPRIPGDHFVNCPLCHHRFPVHVRGKRS